MAYEPTVWANGDTITAEKLNKAENGIAAANDNSFIVHATSSESSVSVTESTSDIISAINSGKRVYCLLDENYCLPLTYVKDLDVEGDEIITFEQITAALNSTASGNTLTQIKVRLAYGDWYYTLVAKTLTVSE